MNTDDLHFILNNSQSRSGKKLAILLNGFNSMLSNKKMDELSYFEIVWQEFTGELVPRLITSFGQKVEPLPENENERAKILAQELSALSIRHGVTFVTATQGETEVPIKVVKGTDPFTSINSCLDHVLKEQERKSNVGSIRAPK